MVTSNKLSDKKVVKMAEQATVVVIPQRTLLDEVNAHLMCSLCKGYYIDATTIVECLHSFCRSCIIKHLKVKSYCPVCEMMINSAKPNIKPDKALQDIVYKLVPGLFQREMERRQQFYSSRPGPAASATPEQRGEDTERIIFSPEDVISFSLEYADATDTDSISSKSSDSSEPQTSGSTRRYLQCPAVVNISHLKKFLTMKFDIDSTQFSIDILYKRVPLPDYYTLMDIAYIYNWKRNEPMRFFYQITDYIAIRSRYGLFDINRKGSHFRDRKSSPTPTEDTNASSPAPHLNEHGSEASSGTDSPMPDDNNKKNSDTKKHEGSESIKKDESGNDNSIANKFGADCLRKNSDDEVEKSNFLISFELTKTQSTKPSPTKVNMNDALVQNTKTEHAGNSTSPTKNEIATSSGVSDSLLKRKQVTPSTSADAKKIKLETEKQKSDSLIKTGFLHSSTSFLQGSLPVESSLSKMKEIDMLAKEQNKIVGLNKSTVHTSQVSSKEAVPKDVKSIQSPIEKKPPIVEQGTLKRPVSGQQNISSPKRKLANEPQLLSLTQQSQQQKPISPIKVPVTKPDNSTNSSKPVDGQKPVKKMPDLKPSMPSLSPANQIKNQAVNKVRMDLLANNSDPTIDRSKILSQVKSSMSAQGPGQVSGEHLKSLFDSCKINIPSSLSITLTDQKLDQRNANDPATLDPKKAIFNKNLSLGSANNNVSHMVPSPPVHNYIEILKLPDLDSKKPQNRVDGNVQNKPVTASKSSETGQSKSTTTQNKSSETTSAKGPVPSLKPIADTKLGKANSNYAKPTTFQQTFLQSLQQAEKSKLPKNKMQVPKLMPATPKTLNAVKDNNSTISNQTSNGAPATETKMSVKSDSVLDLSTPHNVQSQLGPQQTKALETMQSIANLAKKQNPPLKISNNSQNSSFSSMSSRPLSNVQSPLRIPSTSNTLKPDKITNIASLPLNNSKPDLNKPSPIRQTSASSPSSASPNYQLGSQSSPVTAQPSPRPQTRSPSTSPKLVIAEEKQTNLDPNINQSNQVSSTQLASTSVTKSESPKPVAGPSKPANKPVKVPALGKPPGVRLPMTSNIKPGPSMNAPTDLLNTLPPQLIAQQQAFLRHHMEMQWFKMNQARQYENLIKNITSGVVHQNQNDFNNKESKQ